MTLYKQVGDERIPLTPLEEAEVRREWDRNALEAIKDRDIADNRRKVQDQVMIDKAAEMGLEIER